MRKLFQLALLVSCCVFVAHPAMAQDDDADTDESERLVVDATVSAVSVDDDTNTLTITVDIPDTCTEVGDILQSVDDDVITITVQATFPPDVMCGAQFSTEEIEYTIDTTDLTAGEYTVVVNETEQEMPITVADATDEADTEDDVTLECPTADEETLLYEDEAVCFLYPADYEALSAGIFVLVSKPLTTDALLIITIDEAEDTTLDDITADIDDDALVISEIVLGGQEALVVETENSRVAHIIVDESYYTFTVEPISEDDTSGELLWATVIDSLFFPLADEDDS